MGVVSSTNLKCESKSEGTARARQRAAMMENGLLNMELDDGSWCQIVAVENASGSMEAV